MTMDENQGERIAVACPGCAARFQVKPALAGKSVKCPKCATSILVPAAASEPALEPDSAPRGRHAGARSRGRAGKSRAPQGKKGGKGLLIGGAVVAAAVLVGALVLLLQGGGPPADFLKARDAIASLAPAGQAGAWLDLAQKAEGAQWTGAAEEAGKALQAAESAAFGLKGQEAVAVLLDGGRRLAAGRHAGRVGAWIERAAAAARSIQDPLARMEALVALAGRLETEAELAAGKRLAQGLLQDAAAAAGELKGPGRAAALLDLEGRLPAQGEAAEQLRQQLFQKVLEGEPDNARAHAGLGHERVPAESPVEELRGQWLTNDTQKRIYKNKLAQAELAAAAERKEKERWETRFGRACARLRKEMEREIPGVKWHWFFDDEFAKRPYLLAVEESQSPSTEGIAREQGRVLNGLVTNFYKYYQKLLDLTEPTKPVGVYIFASKASYAEFQKTQPDAYPDPRNIGGFFNGGTTRMYLWAQDEGHVSMDGRPWDLPGTMFHEGTHQLMHYNKKSPGPQIGNSPWLQEGLAEYFGGYYTRVVPGSDPPTYEYRNGKFQKDRYEFIVGAARRSVEAGKVVPGILPLKDLMHLGYDKFREFQWGRERNVGVVLLVYAQGWAFIHFCKNYIKDGKKGYYREKFESYLKAEIEGITDGDRFAQIFGLKSDRDWENLQWEFFRYLLDSDTGMRKYMYESDGRAPGFWPEEDEMG